MPSPDEDDRDDLFAPPQPPIRVCCLLCGEEYGSNEMVWLPRPNIHGPLEDGMSGDWCCPVPSCNGVGFGMDILPTDPTWQDEDGNGWQSIDDEDDDDDNSFDPDAAEEEDDFTYSGFDAPEEIGPFWKHDPTVLRPADAPDELNVDIDAQTEQPLDRMFERDDQDIPF